ncbi:MAG TPA: hypothetical protein VG323_20995 [Thermoanaerobaculia bacterium]|nr:hypothetical protein [Thermoanaerobaculia bacterium]
MIEIGTLCRSKDAIVKFENDEQGRLCRVVAVVPDHRCRQPGVPEYRVELVGAPVRAFRRAADLEIVSTSEPVQN